VEIHTLLLGNRILGCRYKLFCENLSVQGILSVWYVYLPHIY